jgi:hypothetical protein
MKCKLSLSLLNLTAQKYDSRIGRIISILNELIGSSISNAKHKYWIESHHDSQALLSLIPKPKPELNSTAGQKHSQKSNKQFVFSWFSF